MDLFTLSHTDLTLFGFAFLAGLLLWAAATTPLLRKHTRYHRSHSDTTTTTEGHGNEERGEGSYGLSEGKEERMEGDREGVEVKVGGGGGGGYPKQEHNRSQ